MIPRICAVSDQMTLRVCQTEKFKAEMLSLSVLLPIERSSTYMTSLLLAVLRRGTEKYPTLADINRRLDYLYGTELSIRNFYRGDSQVIGFSAELLNDAYLPKQDESLLCGVLDVMTQILFHPLLDENGCLLEKYVESEKQQQCDRIRARKNHPRSYASERLRELLYADEPCGVSVYGTEEEVMAVTAETLTAHWKKLISHARPDCFYIGNADVKKVEDALSLSLGQALTGMREAQSLCRSVIPPMAREIRYTEEELPVSQGQLVLGLRSGVSLTDADFYAAAVYNELLGASPSSKLFMNVREKESLCYHCASTYNVYKGTVVISCGLENSNRDRAERSILAQVEAIAKNDFTEDELCAAKKSLESAYRILEDSPSALESYYYGRALVGIDQPLSECRASFASVTREDVIAFAQKVRVDVVYYLKGTLENGEGDDDDADMD